MQIYTTPKVDQNSTQTFRRRHLLLGDKQKKFSKVKNFSDAKWFATNFKSSALYQSVHEYCQSRLDDIISKGYFIFRGEKRSVQTIIVKITGTTMVIANIRRPAVNIIHVEYKTESCTNMHINEQGLFHHYKAPRQRRKSSISSDISSDDDYPECPVQYHKFMDILSFV